MGEEQIIVGGQAVIEGVMMRAPHSYAVAVRRPDGQIVAKGQRLPSLAEQHPALKLPILRGAAILIQSMVLGIKALNFSASVAFEAAQAGEAQPGTLATGEGPPVSSGAQATAELGPAARGAMV